MYRFKKPTCLTTEFWFKKNVEKEKKCWQCNCTFPECNCDGGVLLSVKLQAKSNTLPWVFSRFKNCADGTKLRNASKLILGLRFQWPLCQCIELT